MTPDDQSPNAAEAKESKEFGLLGFIEGRAKPAPGWDQDRVATYPHLVSREFLAFGVMLMALLVVSFLFDAPLEELANPGKTPNPAKAPWYFLSLQELLHYAPPFIAGVLIPGLLIAIMCIIPYFHGKKVLIPVGMLIASLVVPLFDGIIWAGIHAFAPGFADKVRVYGFPTLILLVVSCMAITKLVVRNPKLDDEKVVERLRNRLFVVFVAMLGVLVLIGQYFRGPEWRWVWPWQ